MLEVWAAPLSGGRFAVVLFNRSPGDDSIVVHWADIGVDPNTRLDVYDVWANANRQAYIGNYTAAVPARATAYLLLTPAL
jgi:alpha-galactosidase